MIEHNLDVIKSADWVIDLGPEGGDKGGWVIAEGTPEHVTRVERSYTGQFLKHMLAGREAMQPGDYLASLEKKTEGARRGTARVRRSDFPSLSNYSNFCYSNSREFATLERPVG